MSVYILTAQYGKARTRSVVGFFLSRAEALKEFLFQAHHNRQPKVYQKETTDAANRRIHLGGSILSGAQEVDLFKVERVKPPATKRIQRHPWAVMHKVARQYAAADKTDTHCYDRAMSLMANGVAEPKHYEKGGRL